MTRGKENDDDHLGDKLPHTTLWSQQVLPHAKYTHPLLRPSIVSSHYGISLMSRILISNSGPGVSEAPQMQFLRYCYWSIVPFDLNKETNYLLPHTQHINIQ